MFQLCGYTGESEEDSEEEEDELVGLMDTDAAAQLALWCGTEASQVRDATRNPHWSLNFKRHPSITETTIDVMDSRR